MFQSNHDSDSIAVSIMAPIYAFGMIFIACELSQRLTNAYSKIDDIFEQFEWYRFPNAVRRALPTIISMVQKPVEFECFGNVSCSRESFKKVRSS